MPKELGPHQKRYFDRLRPSDRKEVIANQERELSVCLFQPPSPARDHRVAELELRLAYLRRKQGP